MCIEQKLANKFIEIVGKHQNPLWAREELEWLVFDKHRDQYEQLNRQEKLRVLDYFDGLTKLHGGGYHGYKNNER